MILIFCPLNCKKVTVIELSLDSTLGLGDGHLMKAEFLGAWT